MSRRVSPRLLQREAEEYAHAHNNNVVETNPYSAGNVPPFVPYTPYVPHAAPQTYMAPLDPNAYPPYQYPPENAQELPPFVPQAYAPYAPYAGDHTPARQLLPSLPRSVEASPADSADNFEIASQSEQAESVEEPDMFERNANYVEGAIVDGKKMRRKRANKNEVPLDFASRKYACESCDKRFARPYALATHNLSHTKEKPFACVGCDRSFAVLSNLKRHCKTHDHPIPDVSGAVFAVRGASAHAGTSRSVHD